MSEILSLSLRPKTLTAMVGQKSLAAAIRKQMATRPPRALLFTGGTGVGKTTIARIIAVAVQCQHQKEWGDPCDACWDAWKSWTIHEINASDVSGVEELSKVADLGRYKPTPPSLRRVIILDEMQRASSAAQNMMLKPFEDAPETTLWILCTTEPSKILATLRRRCVAYAVRSLSMEARELMLKRAAKRAGIERPIAPLIEQAHLADIGSPALLLMALEKYASGLAAQEAVCGFEEAGIDTLRICKAVTAGDWNGVKAVMKDATADHVRWIRASVGGWIKGALLRESNPKRQAMLAECLLELAAPIPLDDGVLPLWMWGTLYRITRRFQ